MITSRKNPRMKNVVEIEHPLVEHSLSVLRNRETGTAEFRRHAAGIARILMLEATRDLLLENVSIETPMQQTEGRQMAEKVVLVPVLRAGLAMLFACQDMLPSSAVGFLGLERDERTAVAREYYKKLPHELASSRVLVLDPMLATGGSMDDSLAAARDSGAVDMTAVCIVAAPEGLSRITEKYPDTRIITAAIDSGLDERKFIVPGLGDFGDRYFGT